MGRAQTGQAFSLFNGHLSHLFSVPGTLHLLSPSYSVPALWCVSLWPLSDGNWSSAALGTEESLSDNQPAGGSTETPGSPGSASSKPSWISASPVTARGPAGARSRICSCSLHPHSIQSRQGRCCGWLAPGITPHACPRTSPSQLPSRRGRTASVLPSPRDLVAQPDGILILPWATGLVPKWPNPDGVGAPGH